MVIWVKPPEGFKHNRRQPQGPHWEDNKGNGNVVLDDAPVMDWREESQLPADFTIRFETEDEAEIVWGEMTVGQRALAWGMTWGGCEADEHDDYEEYLERAYG